MSYELLALAILALGLIGYGVLRHRRGRKADAEWEAQHPRSAFKYCGRTLLFYDDAHGNQVEFLAPDGY